MKINKTKHKKVEERAVIIKLKSAVKTGRNSKHKIKKAKTQSL